MPVFPLSKYSCGIYSSQGIISSVRLDMSISWLCIIMSGTPPEPRYVLGAAGYILACCEKSYELPADPCRADEGEEIACEVSYW